MPVETCQKYTGTLSEILALTPVVQTIADATDVPGVRLEWMNGAWYGDCGFPSAAQHSALLAANAYNSLAAGGVTCTVSGVQYTWRGAGSGGWVSAYPLDADALMCFGDSITEMGFSSGENPSGAGTYVQTRESMETVMQKLLGFKRFRRLYNCGYGGSTATQFARQPGEPGYDPAYDGRQIISANNAKDMALAFGTNDLSNESLTPEQIFGSISRLAQWGTEYGKRVHIKGVLPRGTGYTFDSATRRARALRLNRLLKDACARNNWGWVPTVDAFSVATSTTEWSVPWGTTGQELLYDGVHPSSYGVYLGAKAMRDHFLPLRSDRKDIGATHFLDTISSDATSKQLVKNPRFNGTTSWPLYQPGGVFTSVVYSTIPSPDGVGNALVIDMEYSGAGNFNVYQQLDTINIAKGVYVGAAVAVELQGLNGTGSPIGYNDTSLSLTLDSTDQGTGVNLASTTIYGGGANSARMVTASAGLIVLETVPIAPKLDVLPNRFQQISVRFYTKAAGSCRIVLYAIQATIMDPLYGAIPWRP